MDSHSSSEQRIAELEARLAQAERERDHFKALFDQAPAFMASVWGPEYTYRYSNPLNNQLLGGREVVGKPLEEALHPGESEVLIPLLDEVYRTGVPYIAEELEAHVLRDGRLETIYISGVYQPLPDAEGRVQGVLSHAIDVTNQVLARRMLTQRSEEAEALTERIVAHVTTGICYIDRDRVFRWINPALLNLLGLTAEQALDRPVFEALPGSEPQLEAFFRQVFETGQPVYRDAFPFTYTIDGELRLRHWDFTYQPVRDAQGEVEGLLAVATEVTDRVEKERLQAERLEHLRKADQMKDEFLSVVSHELRTPLNFIMGFASILGDELHGPLNDLQKHDVERILAGSDRMLGLVNDLLDVAKIQAGRLELFREPTALGDLVDEVVSSLVPLAEARPVDLRTDVPPLKRPTVDRPRMTQVLTNLVSNAIKFTPAGGQIEVRAAERDGAVVLEVADTGIGIDPDHLPRLFEPFSQLDMSPTREVGGSGLGLAITKAIVEAHGGEVGVDSVPGRGSTFWFTLPVG